MIQNLQRWDIIFVKQDETDLVGHPAVVLSPPDILNDPRHRRINVLVGTKKPPAANAKTSEVILNGADGLEFLTLINAAMVFQVRKASILRYAGSVTYARRAPIAQKLRAALGLG